MILSLSLNLKIYSSTNNLWCVLILGPINKYHVLWSKCNTGSRSCPIFHHAPLHKINIKSKFGEDEGTFVLGEHFCLEVGNEKIEDGKTKMNVRMNHFEKKRNNAISFNATWDMIAPRFSQAVTSSIFHSQMTASQSL